MLLVLKRSSLFQAVGSVFSFLVLKFSSLFRATRGSFSKSLVSFERLVFWSVLFERFAPLSQDLKSPLNGALLVLKFSKSLASCSQNL